ncbi:MAG: phosphatase PAP2 family protein [Eubacteriales bacterium]
MSTFKTFIHKYKDCWLLLFAAFYLAGFFFVENITVTEYHIISSVLDDYIPFCEYFVIPYFLWFPYMLVPVIYFYIHNRRDYNKLAIMGALGMTLFLIISLIYPNTLIIRPETFARDNIFTACVSFLHSIDTCTNVFPSIHVYNSLVVHMVIIKSENLKGKLAIHITSWILCISIILSTVFLKQHSVIDVFGAFALYAILYPFIQKCKA